MLFVMRDKPAQGTGEGNFCSFQHNTEIVAEEAAERQRKEEENDAGGKPKRLSNTGADPDLHVINATLCFRWPLAGQGALHSVRTSPPPTQTRSSPPSL